MPRSPMPVPPLLLLLTVLLGAPVLAQAVGRQKQRPVPDALTAQCGLEIPWESDPVQALSHARALGRPVFWYVPTVAGSPMDRKDIIDLYMMSGPFAHEDVATLLERHFVPVKAAAQGGFAEGHDLRPQSFIEPGFLVLAPDGACVLRIDRVTTLIPDWFVARLREARVRAGTASRDSDAVLAARAGGSPEALAQAFLEELDGAEALRALGPGDAGESAERLLLRARAQALLGRGEEALATLRALSQDPTLRARALAALGRLLLAEDRRPEALSVLSEAALEDGPHAPEAALHAALLHFDAGADDEARALLARVAARWPRSRHGRKAAAELQGFGPYRRGFERLIRDPTAGASPAGPGTGRPRTLEELDRLRAEAVDLLLRHQRRAGHYDDSNYDFGGTDSLPNVHAAVTALAALALHAHRDVSPRAEGALRRAVAWLLDEGNLAPGDEDEIAWAHAYRLLLFRRLLADGTGNQEAVAAKCREIERALEAGQGPRGSWRHEYPNPFVTATVVEALARGDRNWRRTPAGLRSRAREALERARGPDGTFRYGDRGAPGSHPSFSAGRSPICELALLRLGASSDERLQAALELARKNHEHLERVRKYDDHADAQGNGGFFFWYALLGRRQAAEALADPGQRQAELDLLRDLVLGLPELDGGFVDSHELGRSYGTAVALLCLDPRRPGP
jgi:hypothetical protein